MAILLAPQYEVPVGLANSKHTIQPLTTAVAGIDWVAVCSVVPRVRSLQVVPPGFDGIEPPTVFQNVIDLCWHERETGRRTTLAYTVLSPDSQSCLGCIYMYPSTLSGIDAEIYMWATQEGVEPELYDTVRVWVDEAFPFRRVAYPGRDGNLRTYDFPKLVPSNVEIPDRLDGERFALRPLGLADVAKDYDAWISSVEHLSRPDQRIELPGGVNGIWPQLQFSPLMNFVDLGWHMREFQQRSSFAYAVIDKSDTRILGTVYIFPAVNEAHDALILMWVREELYPTGLDAELEKGVREWISSKWPFKRPCYPNRDHI